MSIRFLKPLAGLTLALAAGFVNASTVVTFTTPAAKKQTTYSDTTDGYAFSSNFLGVPTKLLTLTGTTLKEGPVDTLKVTSLTGTAFDLASFDIDSAVNVKGLPNFVVLTYTEADGTSGHETLKLDSTSGMQTFASLLGNLDTLTDLKSFSLSSVYGFTLDNVTLSPYKMAAAVPEPESLALMLAGLAMLGTVARRRKA